MKEEEVFIILKNILDIVDEEDSEVNENSKSNININDEDLNDSDESINSNICNNANIDINLVDLYEKQNLNDDVNDDDVNDEDINYDDCNYITEFENNEEHEVIKLIENLNFNDEHSFRRKT